MKKILMLIIAMMMMVKVEAAEVIIFHTNDIHARVNANDDGGKAIALADLSAYVKAMKVKNKNTFWFDAGDTFHGMPSINISKGINMVNLLNATPLDLMVPGNHDFDYGMNQLMEIQSKLKAQILSANIIKQSTRKYIFEPSKIYKTKDGIKIGVFGLSTPETKYKSKPQNTEGLEFLNPVEKSKLMIRNLRNQCDILVAVMHMGLDESSEFTSKRVAEETEGIDLIIDGHSHTKLPNGMKVKNTLIVQTGEQAQNLGQVKIEVENHKVKTKSAKLISKTELQKMIEKSDVEVLKVLNQVERNNEAIFNTEITHSDKKLSSERLLVRRRESELGNLVTDAFRWKTKADIAVINGGGLRADLPAGIIKYGDLLALFPFENVVQTVDINGAVIRAMLEHSVSAYPEELGGFLQVSGMTFSFDPNQPVGRRIKEVYVNGKLLNDKLIYTLATNDFLISGGDDYQMLKGAKIMNTFGTCEEILSDYLNTQGIKDIELGRIKITSEVKMKKAA